MIMPDKEMIFNRLYAVDGMLTTLYERLEGKADVSTVEMVWGIRDYLEHSIEDVQALVLALEPAEKITD
jgi:hypothetical protein